MIKKLIEFFIAPELRADRETHRKASFTVASCLVVIAFSFFGVAYAAVFIDSISYLSVGLAFLFLVILSLFLFRKKRFFFIYG